MCLTRWWYKYYLSTLLSTLACHIIGIVAILTIKGRPFSASRYHKCNGWGLLPALLLHLAMAGWDPYIGEQYRPILTHLHTLSYVSIMLLGFSSVITGLSVLEGLPSGTVVYVSVYLFWMMCGGLVVMEMLYVYYPVQLPAFFKRFKICFILNMIVIAVFGATIPLLFFVL